MASEDNNFSLPDVEVTAQRDKQTITSTIYSNNPAGMPGLLIRNKTVDASGNVIPGKIFAPVTLDEITLTRVRKGAPSVLEFKVMKDDGMGKLGGFAVGDEVIYQVGKDKTFYGFVFKKTRTKEGVITVTAYDQIRYLKNKYSFVYTNKTASDVIKDIATVYGLRYTADSIADTEFVIAKRSEDNVTMLNAIQNALDITMMSQEVDKRKLFVLYDDFATLTLKNIEDMFTDYAITANTAQDFTYSTSIDGSTYNSIELYRDNRNNIDQQSNNTDGVSARQIFPRVEDTNNIARWGLLRLSEKINEAVQNPQAYAENLLDLFNKEQRSLEITKAYGDLSVRGGSGIIVCLDLGDMILRTRMIVDKVVHHFNQSEHWMDLTLIGHKWFYGTSQGSSGGTSTKKGAVTSKSVGNDVSNSVEERYSVLAGTYYGSNGCTAAVRDLLPNSNFIQSNGLLVPDWYKSAVAQEIFTSSGTPGDVVVINTDGSGEGSHVVVLGVNNTYYGNSTKAGGYLIQGDMSDFSGEVMGYILTSQGL